MTQTSARITKNKLFTVIFKTGQKEVSG